MICAIHYARFLMDEGDPENIGVVVSRNGDVTVPAATTVYNGIALCRECFVAEIDNMPPTRGEMPTGEMT